MVALKTMSVALAAIGSMSNGNVEAMRLRSAASAPSEMVPNVSRPRSVGSPVSVHVPMTVMEPAVAMDPAKASAAKIQSVASMRWPKSECERTKLELEKRFRREIARITGRDITDEDDIDAVKNLVRNGIAPEGPQHEGWLSELYGPPKHVTSKQAEGSTSASVGGSEPEMRVPMWWSGFWVDPKNKNPKNDRARLQIEEDLIGGYVDIDMQLNEIDNGSVDELMNNIGQYCPRGQKYFEAHSQIFSRVGIRRLQQIGVAPLYVVNIGKDGNGLKTLAEGPHEEWDAVENKHFYKNEFAELVKAGNLHTKLNIKTLGRDNCEKILAVLNSHPAVEASGKAVNPDACRARQRGQRQPRPQRHRQRRRKLPL